MCACVRTSNKYANKIKEKNENEQKDVFFLFSIFYYKIIIGLRLWCMYNCTMFFWKRCQCVYQMFNVYLHMFFCYLYMDRSSNYIVKKYIIYRYLRPTPETRCHIYTLLYIWRWILLQIGAMKWICMDVCSMYKYIQVTGSIIIYYLINKTWL